MAADWPRPIVHVDIVAKDPEGQRRFYAEMFGWEIGEGPVMSFAAGFGGPEPGPAGHLIAGEVPAVRLYVQVASLAESLERARALGAEVLAEPFDLPGAPTLAVIRDPEGLELLLVQQ